MTKAWNEFAKQKRKEFGVKASDLKIILPHCKRPLKEFKPEPIERRFNIHKRSTSGTIDNLVMCGLPSKKAAEHTIKYATDKKGKPVFQTRVYRDKIKDRDAYIFYEAIPGDATPEERSIYFNAGKIVTESIPGYPIAC